MKKTSKTHQACVLLREATHYRRELFREGLRRLGYTILDGPQRQPNPGDVLVLWNRHRMHEMFAKTYEKHRGVVLVAENGYVGTDAKGQRLFALAKSYHNGAGTWKVGDRSRWEAMNIDLKPWRTAGEFVLMLPQRGIGPAGVAMPLSWQRTALQKVQKRTQRKIVIRPHPGTSKADPYDALANCFAAVTWGSGAAIKAIVAGIPVYHEFRSWIGAPAATLLDTAKNLERPFLGDRLPMLHRLAWAQWSPDEIGTGEAFKWLLSE